MISSLIRCDQKIIHLTSSESLIDLTNCLGVKCLDWRRLSLHCGGGINQLLNISSPRSFWNAFFPCVECREGRSGKPFCLPFGFLYVPPCCVDHQEIHESESTTTSPTTITPTTTKITSATTYSATTSLTMETTTTSQITPTLPAEKDPSKLYNTKGIKKCICCIYQVIFQGVVSAEQE